MPAPLIGAGISAIGGLLGNLFGSSERDAAERERKANLERIMGISLPTFEEQEIELERMRSAGELTPEMEDAISQEASKMEGVSADPRLQDTQYKVLDRLSKQGEEGLTAEDRAALNQVRREGARDQQSTQQSILAQMGARGAGGAGAELAAQLSSSQAGADRGSQESDRLAAMAQQRALQALSQSGTMATGMRGQEFGEKSDIARAQDEITRFNTANRQNVQQRNVASRNNAQAGNLSNAQNIMNQNVHLSNQQQMHNKALAQSQFDNRLKQAQAASGASQAVSAGHTANANATAALGSGVGAALNTGIGAMAKQSSGTTPTGQDQEDFMNNDNTAGFTMPGGKVKKVIS